MVVPRFFSWTIVCLFIGISIAPLAYLFMSPILGDSGSIIIKNVFEGRHLFFGCKKPCYLPLAPACLHYSSGQVWPSFYVRLTCLAKTGLSTL